ncbi:contact-dependent growth inhibition system immunity protein [uncultured Rubinisphaera sp.]|uniref:contact-dependent growth inhibition system immunity protein n=1 Tax=uncultured Rubinisphaera sp. TaxID=1678686 RepID=UPI0030D9427B|tara:strand:+ start:646 stop:1071 length:426 start_codon:yes stop_codon:yes gene_type:complete
MKTSFDRQKTLQELESEDWGEPDYHTHLVQTCHKLRRVPLADFTVGDLRIMIGQNISLLFLIPLALEKLEKAPLVESNCYPGDLLKVVLDVPETFWNVHTDMRELIREIVLRSKELLESLEGTDAHLIREILAEAHNSLHK